MTKIRLPRTKNNPKANPGKSLRNNRGQSLVEFAFASPLLLLLLVGIVYLGKGFYQLQVLSFTAQEGVRLAARVPNLQDTNTRDFVRGFSTGGSAVNPSSIIYTSLGAANLLSHGNTGDLPPGAMVRILPWDGDGSVAESPPLGTIAVKVEYPFSLLINPFTGQSATPVTKVALPTTLDPQAPQITFPDFLMAEEATASQEVYQQ